MSRPLAPALFSVSVGRVVAVAIVFWAVPALAQTDESTPLAEKEFGKIAEQKEFLKTPPLPDWTKKKRIFEEGVEYLIAGTAAPVMSAADAEASLDREMQKAVQGWIRERFSAEVAENLEVPIETIRGKWMVNHLPVPCIFDMSSTQPGLTYPMYQSFSQLAMTDSVFDDISNLWKVRKRELLELRRTTKLTQWTIISGAVVLALACLHSYFRLNLLSEGSHSRKLGLVLAGTLLALGLMATWLVNILT
jgi:hypothetical protein